MSNNRSKTRQLTGMALFTAIVVVLQFLGAFIRFGPFSISLVLIPIVVGAAMYGAGAGAWLGFMFGVAVLLSGDAAAFMVVHAPGTVITVLLKGALAGFAAGAVFRALEKFNTYAAVVVSAIVCPVVNTGIFLLGCRLFFFETVASWGAAAGFENVGTYMVVGLVGLNFVVEMAINIVMAPIVLRIIKFGKKG